SPSAAGQEEKGQGEKVQQEGGFEATGQGGRRRHKNRLRAALMTGWRLFACSAETGCYQAIRTQGCEFGGGPDT
ncbi:hypothetical protein JZ751_015010, partial [Albula glossodonta]